MTQPDHASNVVREDEMELDLRNLLNVIKKWSHLIILGTLFCTLIAGIISYFVLPPVYQAQTLLMVTQATEKLEGTAQQQQGEDLGNVVPNVSSLPLWTMNTYLGQIKSEALMNRVIKKLKLDKEYSSTNMAAMIEATIVKDSNLIDLKVENGDPRLAARIANTVSEEYMQFMSEKNREQIGRSMKFLEEEKVKNDQELQKALERLEEFQSRPRGVSVLEAEFTSRTQDMVTFNAQLKTVRVEIEQLYAGIPQLQQELDATPEEKSFSSVENPSIIVQEINPVYSSLSQMLAEKKIALAEKEGEAQGLQTLLSSNSAQLDVLQAELSEKRAIEDALKRDVERLQKTSQTLAEKGAEAQIARSLNLGDTSVTILSEAFISSEPIRPNKKLNISIAILLGLMIFILLAFVLEYLDNTLKTPEDISRELNLPVLGVIPSNTKGAYRKKRYGG
ncbi:MAG: Wzz/FepE/Etk N-terminal domain-containing protein [Syntrophomonas sp.]